MTTASSKTPAGAMAAAIRTPKKPGAPAIVAYITAGFPTLEAFPELVAEVADAADVVEIGLPFSDPMADGATIQEASRIAIENGASVDWAMRTLAGLPDRPEAPLVVMSYLNPLMRYGLARFADDAAASHVTGVIIPDLPFDEATGVAEPLRARGLGVVQMATIVSAPDRLAAVGRATGGFLYAVTSVGTTGRGSLDTSAVAAFLDGLRGLTDNPVCAGFGVRTPDHVRALAPHCDGVIVGSALVETIGSGGSAKAFIDGLRE